MAAKVVWATSDADKLIGWMARVSNPKANPDDDASKLISYLITHKHWSPLEMASVCVELETTRDIGRQLIRHRSFHFQEFSQRYAAVEQEEPILRAPRLQDPKNRQNSLELADELSLDDEDSVRFMWKNYQDHVWDSAYNYYLDALELGIAKEQARALLPEGLTSTKMFMAGTVRDWLHYLSIRTGKETQLEHRVLAEEILLSIEECAPTVFRAARQAGLIGADPNAGQTEGDGS